MFKKKYKINEIFKYKYKYIYHSIIIIGKKITLIKLFFLFYITNLFTIFYLQIGILFYIALKLFTVQATLVKK
jgi:hypothetical protein